MQEVGGGLANPELKELLAEASCALARLDAGRLEELAISCEALNCSLGPMSIEERRDLARQAMDAMADMAVFARVLDATRANLNVMKRLRELRAVRLEYSERMTRGGTGAGSASVSCCRWSEGAEAGHGDD
ncbi:MAG: hypothetical protein WBC92_07685 [Terracidiphilus sp.]